MVTAFFMYTTPHYLCAKYEVVHKCFCSSTDEVRSEKKEGGEKLLSPKPLFDEVGRALSVNKEAICTHTLPPLVLMQATKDEQDCGCPGRLDNALRREASSPCIAAQARCTARGWIGYSILLPARVRSSVHTALYAVDPSTYVFARTPYVPYLISARASRCTHFGRRGMRPQKGRITDTLAVEVMASVSEVLEQCRVGADSVAFHKVALPPQDSQIFYFP
ncbi:hypothetical protein BGZ63DRAFT_400037 [Mariannaea sp. PMI_226]|nr:hypothetical protein BGZ63DRAFT_400037 [Mariannaea sp. PMI_226]